MNDSQLARELQRCISSPDFHNEPQLTTTGVALIKFCDDIRPIREWWHVTKWNFPEFRIESSNDKPLSMGTSGAYAHPSMGVSSSVLPT